MDGLLGLSIPYPEQCELAFYIEELIKLRFHKTPSMRDDVL